MKNTLKYKGFLGSVEIGLEDGVVFGKILFINDLILYQAETVPGLKAEFESAVDDYLETCEQLGREPQKPFSGTFNIRIGPELHQGVAEYAAENGIKVNEVVKLSIAKFLEKPKHHEVVHNHIHKHEMVSRQEIPFFPVTKNSPGADYELTTELQ